MVEVRENLFIINASPAQREILKNEKYRSYFEKMILDFEKWNRPRIPVESADEIIDSLKKLIPVLEADPEYAKRQPRKVVERIILNVQDGCAAQARTYG